jgi:hypothetical protein
VHEFEKLTDLFFLFKLQFETNRKPARTQGGKRSDSTRQSARFVPTLKRRRTRGTTKILMPARHMMMRQLEEAGLVRPIRCLPNEGTRDVCHGYACAIWRLGCEADGMDGGAAAFHWMAVDHVTNRRPIRWFSGYFHLNRGLISFKMTLLIN